MLWKVGGEMKGRLVRSGAESWTRIMECNVNLSTLWVLLNILPEYIYVHIHTGFLQTGPTSRYSPRGKLGYILVIAHHAIYEPTASMIPNVSYTNDWVSVICP